jgi:hypothetical protein
MYRATELVVTERVTLSESYDYYQQRWKERMPDSPPLLHPDLRIAAYVIALERCRTAAEQRGVWP